MCIIINNINPALRIISFKNKCLLIAHTKEGAKLAYLPNIALEKIHFNEFKPDGKENILDFPRNSDQLIQNLYQESLEFLKGPFLQSGQYPYILINTDPPHIKEHITHTLKEWKNKNPFLWRFQLKTIPENIDIIVNLIKEISTINEMDKTHFNIQLQFPYYEGWRDSLCFHLDEMFSHNFLTTSIYIAESAVLEEQQKLIQWLDILQDSGFSFPVLFDSPKIMLTQKGQQIIDIIIQNGLSRYIGIDPFRITRLKNLIEMKEYIENYTRLLSSWIQKGSYPFLGLRDFIYLFSSIMEPLSQRFVFLRENFSFENWNELDKKKSLSLWNEFSSYSGFLGEILPILLPFHFYEDTFGRIKTIPKYLVYEYAAIYERCMRFIIKVIFKECLEGITANHPLSLDLNLEKPVYHFQEWKIARTVLSSFENETKE